jgi:hypothetical protein
MADCRSLAEQLQNERPGFFYYSSTAADRSNYVPLKSNGTCSVGVVNDPKQASFENVR